MKSKETLSERITNGIDGLIGFFSPKAAYKRKAFRRAQAMLGSYRGADKTRLRGRWWPGGGSADEDLLPDLAALRESLVSICHEVSMVLHSFEKTFATQGDEA